MTNKPTIDGVSREMLLNKCACGSTDISFCYESPQAHWILCDECGETSPSFENKGSALDHWNKRAPAVERQELGDPAGSFDKHMEYMQENIRLQSTIARLEARIAELENGRGEPIGTLKRVGQVIVFDAIGDPHIRDDMEVFTAPPAPVAQQLDTPTAYLRNEGEPNNLVVCGFDHPDAFKVFRVSPAPVAALWEIRIPDEPQNPESPAEYFYAQNADNRDLLLMREGATAVAEYACLDATAALNGERK